MFILRDLLPPLQTHFSTPLRLYQPYACATDTDGEGQKNGQKLTHQSGEEPRIAGKMLRHQGCSERVGPSKARDAGLGIRPTVMSK